MMDLTIFVIPTGKHDWSDLQKVIEGMGAKCIPIGDTVFSFLEAETKWKMFLYDNEVLTPQMQAALTEFVKYGEDYDFFSCYKIELGEKRITTCPRLFKSYVKLTNNSLIPDGEYRGVHILNGFIRSQADVVH
jgi:hypothetical protein